MSWVVTAIVVTTAVTADAQKKAAKAQEYELERQAEQEKISAESRELERRQRLNKILAANVVSQAASGIKAEGTPESIALESAKQASLSEGIESLSDKLRQAALKRQAAETRRAGNAQVASTLLSSTVDIAKQG